VFPQFTPKFFADEQGQVFMDQSGNEIFTYRSPQFADVKMLGIKENDRKLMFLTEKFNSMMLDKDYLKVPRVVALGSDEYVDVKTGRTISKRTFALKRKKGDLSLFQVYGYKKVKHEDGSPLVTNTGKYVYKLINLWGDGQLASEYYTDARPSAFDNGTVKIDNEILDADLINHFSPKSSQKNVVSLPQEQKENMNVDKTLSWGEIKNLPVYSEKGINTMRKQNTNEHFGNPFTGSGVHGLIQKNSVEEAVQAYKDWLLTDKYKNVKPEQKQWILSQIEQGNLDNKVLLYMKDKGEYYSHADALKDIASNKISVVDTPTLSNELLQDLQKGSDLNTNDFKC
jgi:hypothetical protein